MTNNKSWKQNTDLNSCTFTLPTFTMTKTRPSAFIVASQVRSNEISSSERARPARFSRAGGTPALLRDTAIRHLKRGWPATMVRRFYLRIIPSLHYISTRGEAPELGFEDVMLAGLAADGGLYVPARWPSFTGSQLEALQGKPYAEIAFAIMSPFIGGAIHKPDLRQMITEAYREFGHPAIAPRRQLAANLWLLELFHGPTLAFKDIAMQLLARLMDWALEKRGRRATIVGATSGDTGAAAIEAFKSSRHASIYILHPKGRVSEVQRRQMTTVSSSSVHNIAIEGTFDDCQAIVKSLFNDTHFRD